MRERKDLTTYQARVDGVMYSIPALRFRDALAHASTLADIGMRFDFYDRNLTLYSYMKVSPSESAYVKSWGVNHPLYRPIESL